jgi:cytosine/adenosine deaminase-related metal-dependent hydrolase
MVHCSGKRERERERAVLSPTNQSYKTIILEEDQFLIPGLVDTHIHAPQYVFSGYVAGTNQ